MLLTKYLLLYIACTLDDKVDVFSNDYPATILLYLYDGHFYTDYYS